MSKKSCEAAESVEDAVLRMARVNCNLIPLQHHRFSCRRLYDFDMSQTEDTVARYPNGITGHLRRIGEE